MLLKGPTTLVAEPDGLVRAVVAGDQRLATAGTGDVLSGTIGALLASGMPAFDAAAAGAWLHGTAASLQPAAGLIASDVAAGAPPGDRAAYDPSVNPDLTAHDSRWAWAEVDLDAIAHNVGLLRVAAAPAEVWAVVKADGYGHGAVEVSRAALTAGAGGLCVALTSEGVILRRGRHRRSDPRAQRAAARGRRRTRRPPAHRHRVHGRRRRSPRRRSHRQPCRLASGSCQGRHRNAPRRCSTERRGSASSPTSPARGPPLDLDGVFTHLAVADELDNPYTDEQLQRFDAVLPSCRTSTRLESTSPTRRRPSLVRTPGGRSSGPVSPCTASRPGAQLDALAASLRPALALKARVSHVKRLAAGARVSYGLRHTLPAAATVATVPIGYADGVRRNLSGSGTERARSEVAAARSSARSRWIS